MNEKNDYDDILESCDNVEIGFKKDKFKIDVVVNDDYTDATAYFSLNIIQKGEDCSKKYEKERKEILSKMNAKDNMNLDKFEKFLDDVCKNMDEEERILKKRRCMIKYRIKFAAIKMILEHGNIDDLFL